MSTEERVLNMLEWNLEEWFALDENSRLRLACAMQAKLAQMEATVRGVTQERIPQKGDVYQINEKHGRAGWVGAFVLAIDIRSWGVLGFVHLIKTHEQNESAFIRLEWNHIDYVGKAALVPEATEEGSV